MGRILVFLILFFIFSISEVKAQVVINEFLANPTDESHEWVEFYNSGLSVEDLSSYFFDDDTEFQGESGSAKVQLSGLLSSQSTCYFSLSSYLNNSGDSPTLFTSDGTTKDTYTYASTVEDKSFSRVPDGGAWQIEQTPTQSLVSCVSLAPTPTPTATPTNTPTPTPSPSPTPTSTVTPTPTLKPTSTPKPTIAATKTVRPSATPNLELARAALKSPTPTTLGESTQSGTTSQSSKFPFLTVVCVLVGVGFIGTAFWYNKFNAQKGN